VISKRFFGNVFLIAYLWITFCALLLTVLRMKVFYPNPFMLFSYGMMAPYQSYGATHEEMLAEGQLSDGTWEVIDLAPYYPVLFGERNVREYFAMFNYGLNPQKRLELRERFARRLLELQKIQGKAYKGIRLSWQEWPNMTGEYRLNKIPVILDTALLVEVYEE
jgi:hypothetical protein